MIFGGVRPNVAVTRVLPDGGMARGGSAAPRTGHKGRPARIITQGFGRAPEAAVARATGGVTMGGCAAVAIVPARRDGFLLQGLGA